MTETDRELLELAAKAAGLVCENGHYYGASGWNPLTSDGDALRLAVKLHLYFATLGHSAIASEDESGAFEQVPFEGSDPYAATRRAIVRAAASIGARERE